MYELKFNKQARQSILEGINQASDAIKVTHGKKGRNVLMRAHNGFWRTTKDGITVAKSIQLPDVNEDTGTSMICVASERTVEMAGDGTTATAIIAQSLCNSAMNAINEGMNPVLIKQGMELASQLIVKRIKGIATSAKDENGIVNQSIVRQISMISSNSDEEVGGIVADAIREVGADGMITVENSNDDKTFLEKIDGCLIESGWHNQYLITNQVKQKCELENPYILLYDRKLDLFKPLMPILEQVLKTNSSILIFCEDIVNEALATIVGNAKKGMKVCVVKCPYFGVNKRKAMEDLADMTGGQFISEEKGNHLNKVQLNQLGKAEKVIIEKNRTMIIGGAGDKAIVGVCLDQILDQIKECQDEKEKKQLKERYAKLTGGVAVIKVAGNNAIEIEEKKDRIDDALCASRASIEEGFVAGGGVTYLKLNPSIVNLKKTITDIDVLKGIEIVEKAIKSPFIQLLKNAGIDSKKISHENYNWFQSAFYPKTDFLTQIENSNKNIGYNLENNTIEDLILAGVIDPAKVLRVCLENAVSVAGMFMMTECTVMPLTQK